MDQQMDLSALSGQHLDPEVFRRVWNRVMPDQKDSPIMVSPPAAGQSGMHITDARSAPYITPMTTPPVMQAKLPSGKEAAAVPQTQQQPPPQPMTDARVLEEIMSLAWEGAAALQLLNRRMGSSKQLAALLGDWRRSLRQLAAAYFLATGQQYQTKTATPKVNGNVALALRERYYWECEWAKVCQQRAGQTQDAALEELYTQLAGAGQLHAKMIRSMLERM